MAFFNTINNMIFKTKLDKTFTLRLQRHMYNKNNKSGIRILLSSSKYNNLFSIKMRSNTKSDDLFILSDRIIFNKVRDMMYSYSSNIHRMHFDSISYTHENMDDISKDDRYNDYQIMF